MHVAVVLSLVHSGTTCLICRSVVKSSYGHYYVLFVSAPGKPTKVVVTSNVTDSIVVQWTSPLVVVNRVDRYYIHYQAVSKPHSREMIIDDVSNLFHYHEVNLLSILALVYLLKLFD